MPESPKRVRTRMLGLLELTKNAATRAPAGASLLHQTIGYMDGYPSTASGSGDDGRGGSELSSVELAANRRLGDFYPTFDADGRRHFHPGPTRQLERMTHLIGVATAAMHEILTIADNVAPPPTVQSRDICVGGVGYDWWQPPDHDPSATACANVQELGRAAGLCASCRGRRQRYAS